MEEDQKENEKEAPAPAEAKPIRVIITQLGENINIHADGTEDPRILLLLMSQATTVLLVNSLKEQPDAQKQRLWTPDPKAPFILPFKGRNGTRH